MDELIKHQNIINYVKAQRLSGFGHVHRKPESGIVKKILLCRINVAKATTIEKEIILRLLSNQEPFE